MIISKFSLKDKEHQSLGTLQRFLLTIYLSEKENIHLSDLGPGFLEYKIALGGEVYNRRDYLKN